jgi:DNA-binding SARP family transcriptional activator/predicted ATPase
MSRARPRIELFGAPRVLRGAAEIRLPVKKSLALLAYLAVEGRATRAKLAALFWGESGGEAARRNLRRELHRLREADLGDLLAADDESVALAAAVQSDVGDFGAALAARDRAAAIAAWRGPLMDGFDLAESEEFDRWLAARRDDFARRYAGAALALAAEREGAGDARGALALHAQLIQNDPLQESHYAAAMRLHYLLGERGRALELFERCRATLARELGLQPLPETAALAERIRAAEGIAPLATPAAAAGLTQLAPPMVGRAGELARLAAGPIVTLVSGEPGVGKSRLADEYTRSQPERLRIAASELGRGAPLFPVVEALARAWQDAALRRRIEAIDPAQRPELARVLPSIDPHAAPHADGATSAMRTRLLDAIATGLIALAGDGAIWVDDVHWLDELTLELLHHLAHRLARERRVKPRIVLTARGQELADRAEASSLLLKLERAQLLQRIELAPLDTDATTELVRRLSGAQGGGVFAERLRRSTRGNPFFLLETIRFLFDSGELVIDPNGVWSTRYDDATTDYAELPVPPNVQQAVLERVERLGPAARRVLEAGALAGDGFTLDDVQPATALSEWDALEGLERATAASLILDAEGGYRFGHDLVRLALDRSLGTERRRLIHLRLAEALVGQGGRADRIARHFDEAGRPTQAAPWHLAAARAAERVFAHADALTHYTAVLEAAKEGAARVPLHLARAELLRVMHDLPGVQAELDQLEALARELDLPALAAEVLVWRARLAIRLQRHAPALEFAQQAQQHPAFAELPQRQREDALSAGAFALVEVGRYDEARAIYERELAATASDNARYLGELHYGMANLLTSFGADAEAGEHLQLSVGFCKAAGDEEGRVRSLYILAYTQYTTGNNAAAIHTMDEALVVAERMHSVVLLRNALLNFITYCVGAGDFARAEALVNRAIDVLRYSEDPATQARLQIRIAEVREAQGEIGAALDAARKALAAIEDNGGGLPDFWPWFLLARLLWRCGDTEGAPAVYRQLPGSRAWLPTAAPAVAFFGTVYRLPDAAEDVLAELPKMTPATGVMVKPDLIEYFRAWALHELGRDREALEALMPGGKPLSLTPFALHPARMAALRLEIECALDQVEPGTVGRAEELLPTATPFESIELRAALARATRRRGDAARESELRSQAEAMIERLAKSLSAEPKLAATLRQSWTRRLAKT